jgi:hypothetical protein
MPPPWDAADDFWSGRAMLEELLGPQRATFVSTTIVMRRLATTKPASLKCHTPAEIAGVRGLFSEIGVDHAGVCHGPTDGGQRARKSRGPRVV